MAGRAVLAAAGNGKALWYLTRGTGVVALLLLTASVALGIVEVTRWSSPRWPRFVTAALHKNVSLLVTAFLAVHILTSVFDSYAPIRWLDTVVPFISSYRPIWLGLGALATDLMIALIVTSLLRDRVGHRVWRWVHWTAYACWPVALLHGLGTGTDPRQPWAIALYGGCLVLVVGCVWWRVASRWTVASRQRRVVLLGATVAVPLAVAAFLVAGPLESGWAARAGTPTALLAHPTGSGSTQASGSSQATALSAPFSASVIGTATQGTGSVTIQGTLSGGVEGVITVVLRGTQLAGGGVEMRSSSVSLGSSAHPAEYTGTVTSLAGTQLRMRLANGAGTTVVATADLNLDAAGNVTGSLAVSA